MKRLACIFGRHRWTIRDEDGEVSDMCSRCGSWCRTTARAAARTSRGSTPTSTKPAADSATFMAAVAAKNSAARRVRW
jgi:hypothetical protein